MAVQTILPADLPLAVGDRVQLQQVIMNLAMNGADAMSSVTDRPRVLRIGSKVGGDGSIQVTIKDSGTGIEEAIRHRIFDPLFTTKPTGMGMGLSICRSIIEAHGGRLWASPSDAPRHRFPFHDSQRGAAQNGLIGKYRSHKSVKRPFSHSRNSAQLNASRSVSLPRRTAMPTPSPK